MIFDQQPANRQELYDRIRQSSKDEVILEEMIRFGFWPQKDQLPADPADEIRQRGALQKELAELRRQHGRLRDEAALLRQIRRDRLKASREKQKETKARRERERQERAAAWQERKAKDVVYLGAGVSAGLGNKADGDGAKLRAAGLPELYDAAGIARALDVSVGQVRFLAFSREVSTVSHYETFAVAKKTGGTRTIHAPRPRLKAAQRWILDAILAKVPVHEAAHGFRLGRSVVTNARPHVGRAVVVNLDLADFFPTVRYPRVKGMFQWLGYSEAAATILALLCTAHQTTPVELDGTLYHVADDPVRRLPQGAPTSPAITNVLCQRLDRRLSKAAEDFGFRYTRYADDLTFSSDDPRADVGKLLRRARWLIEKDGFTVHPGKTRVLRRSRRQEVTGVVVNERPAISRATLKRFRAALYQVEKDGPEGKRWGAPGGPVLTQLMGFANYVAMVDPAKGAPLRARAKALLERYPQHAQAPARRAKPAPAPDGDVPADLAGQLAQLAQLHAQGLLTDDEFAAAKKKLLGDAGGDPPPPPQPKPKKPWWRLW